MEIDEYFVRIYELHFDNTKGPVVFEGIIPDYNIRDIIKQYGSVNFLIEMKPNEREDK